MPDDHQDTPDDLTALQDQLAEARDTITALERRQRIDALLADADAIDLDAARLLTERVVAEMDEPDLAAAVDDLRRHKPFLFHRAPSHDPDALMPPRHDAALDPVHDAAHRAATTGHRRDLLAYLRLRRAR